MTKPKSHEAYVKVCKVQVIERIDAGRTLSQACADLGVTWKQVRYWRLGDEKFAEEVRTSVEALTEVKADSMLTLHEDIPDPKVATVAQNGLKWWLNARNPAAFGQKVTIEDDQPHLLAILTAAVQRTIDKAQLEYEQRQKGLPVIELQPAPDPATEGAALRAQLRHASEDSDPLAPLTKPRRQG